MSAWLLAFAPGVFWLWWVYRRDRWEPEPRALVLRTFLWGMAATVPAVLLELLGAYALGSVLPGSNLVVASAFMLVVVGPAEEVCKFLAVRLRVFRHPEFDEPMDGIVYGAAAALGFASLENVGYLLAAQQAQEFGTVFWMRALLSVPGHVLFAALWAYPLGWSKFAESTPGGLTLKRGLLLAMLGHGLFNVFAINAAWGTIPLLILVYLLWRRFLRHARRALDASPHRAAAEPDL